MQAFVYILDEVILYLGRLPNNLMHKMPLVSYSTNLEAPFRAISGNFQEEKIVRSVLWPQNSKRQVTDCDETIMVIMMLPAYHIYYEHLKKSMQVSWKTASLQSSKESSLIELFRELNDNKCTPEYAKEKLDHLIVGRPCQQSENYRKMDVRIAGTIVEMNELPDSKINLDYFASKYKVSTAHFSRLFKRNTYISFAEYRKSQKLLRAIVARHGVNSHSNAAYDAGFYDISHFNKVFKDMFGMTLSMHEGLTYKIL